MAGKLGDDFKIWEGVYDEFPGEHSVSAFANPAMLERWSDRIKEAIAGIETNSPVEDISIVHEYPVILLLALLAAERSIRVLDFGGGLGQTYLSVGAASPFLSRIEYHIVELAELVERGSSLFAKSNLRGDPDAKPRFQTGLANIPDTVDVVHFGAAFHYIDDWRAFLDGIAARKPQYISFGHLLAGDIQSFVSLQNYWDKKIPVRFHDLRELKAALAKLGFDAIYDMFHCHRIFGGFRPLPTEHFPENRRIKYSRDLIFKKRTSPGK